MEKEQNLELCFVDGLIETICHKDMKGMFRGPYYTWCSMSSVNTPVDYESAIQSLKFIQEIIAEDGQFVGIMGFSQGATLALAFLLQHFNDHPLDSTYNVCRFAIFFSCSGTEEERLNTITLSVPSLHVFDEADSMLPMLATKHCEMGHRSCSYTTRGTPFQETLQL
jgi:hypothetical protein